MKACERCGEYFDPQDLVGGLCGRCDDIVHDHYYDTIEEAENWWW